MQQFDHPSAYWVAIWKAFELGIEIEIENPDKNFRTKLLEVLATPPFEHRDDLLINLALRLIKRNMLDLAQHLLLRGRRRDEKYEINMGQIEVRLGNLKAERRQSLRRIAHESTIVNRFGALVVLNKGKNAVDILEEKCDQGFVDGQSVKEILEWPIVDLLKQPQKKRLSSLVS